MTTQKLDLTKPVQTRNGLPATIVATDLAGMFPVAAIMTECGKKYIQRYTANGNHECGLDDYIYDLINVPPPKQKRRVWMNIYRNQLECVHESKVKADGHASDCRIACVEFEIEYYEGEGLQ